MSFFHPYIGAPYTLDDLYDQQKQAQIQGCSYPLPEGLFNAMRPMKPIRPRKPIPLGALVTLNPLLLSVR